MAVGLTPLHEPLRPGNQRPAGLVTHYFRDARPRRNVPHSRPAPNKKQAICSTGGWPVLLPVNLAFYQSRCAVRYRVSSGK